MLDGTLRSQARCAVWVVFFFLSSLCVCVCAGVGVKSIHPYCFVPATAVSAPPITGPPAVRSLRTGEPFFRILFHEPTDTTQTALDVRKGCGTWCQTETGAKRWNVLLCSQPVPVECETCVCSASFPPLIKLFQ